MEPALASIITDKVALRYSRDSIQTVPVPSRSLGSGFVIDVQGHILTCNHVVAGYEELTVTFADGASYGGQDVLVVGRDPVTDLAVVRVKVPRSYRPVRFADSDSLAVGEWVAAVGSPFGLEGSASAGIVSGLDRWGLAKSSGPDFQDFIQTDALINPGNSGGPLVRPDGRVVGVCSFGKTGSNGDLTGIGFATPINLALDIAHAIIRDGKVVRGFLGVNTQQLNPDLRRALGLSRPGGVLVASLADGSPALAAGLEPGDVITGLNGQPVADVREFQTKVAGLAPGTEVHLDFVRRQRELSVAARLAAWPVASSRPARVPAPKHWLGAGVRDLTATEKRTVVPGRGVLVTAIEPGGAAEDAGLRPGDVVVQINFAAIPDVAAYRSAQAQSVRYEGPLLVRVFRGGTAFYVAVGE